MTKCVTLNKWSYAAINVWHVIVNLIVLQLFQNKLL